MNQNIKLALAAIVLALMAGAIGFACKPSTVYSGPIDKRTGRHMMRVKRTVVPVAKDSRGKIVSVGDPITVDHLEPEPIALPPAQ